jgi:hypothetical protein
LPNSREESWIGQVDWTRPETRAKISAANKGRPGRPQSAETRARISAANRRRAGQPRSPEVRAKIAATLKGRTQSPEHRSQTMAKSKPAAAAAEDALGKALAECRKAEETGARVAADTVGEFRSAGQSRES